MRTFRSSTVGPLSSILRRNALRQPSVAGDATPLLLADPEACLTNLERAEVARAVGGALAVEDRYNKRARRTLAGIGRAAPRLERRLIADADAVEAEQAVVARLEAFDGCARSDGLHTRLTRTVSKRVRLLMVLFLALVDVAAFKGAVTYLFNLRDDGIGQIEALALAFMSAGMVISAWFSAHQLGVYLEARKDRELRRQQPEPLEAARDAWRRIGVPALLLAVLMLVSGSIIRLELLDERTWLLYLVAPLFTCGALAAAFFIELKWANIVMDRRDGLERQVRSSSRKARRAERRATSSEADYGRRQQRALALWGIHAPEHAAQAHHALVRIGQARGQHPDFFHPLGPAFASPVENEVFRLSTRIDIPSRLDEEGLTLAQVKARAEAAYGARLARRRPLERVANNGSLPGGLPKIGSSRSPAAPTTASRNGASTDKARS